jgi:hypothetical protein
MASVTFPSSLGGDGKTYSDDASPTTGLANGGHRTRFIPTLQGAVAMASAASTQAQNAQGSANAARGFLESIQDITDQDGFKFKPIVRPTLSLNFADEVYRIYE